MLAVEGEPEFIIRDEADAWDALREILAGDVRVQGLGTIRLVGWPRLKVELSTGDASITPSMMEGFVELQKELYRSHMLLAHDTEDLRRLTQDERQALEFSVRVRRGSSKFEIDLQPILQQLGQAVVDKMEPVHLVIAILGGALIWAGASVTKAYLQSRLEMRRAEVLSQERRDMLEAQQFTSEQETRRMEILAEAVGRVRELEAVRHHSDTARHAMLNGLAGSEVARISGVEVSGPVAAELRRAPRTESEEVEVQGTFRVLRVDTTTPDGFRVRIQNVRTQNETTVGVGDSIVYAGVRERLQEAEWEKANVALTIRGRERAGRLVEGIVIAAAPPPEVAA